MFKTTNRSSSAIAKPTRVVIFFYYTDGTCRRIGTCRPSSLPLVEEMFNKARRHGEPLDYWDIFDASCFNDDAN